MKIFLLIFFVKKLVILSTVPMAIQYDLPTSWIGYDKSGIATRLIEAKAAVQTLQSMPFQRRWVEELHQIQLKMEVDGTSRIEGADFAGDELDAAIRSEGPEPHFTRSQKQARAAMRTYRWLAKIPDYHPISADLIKSMHERIVTGCDDDRCEPGTLRRSDQNVTFGFPRHRGVQGGKSCVEAFERLVTEANTTFHEHDPLVQAIAMHYHIAAMHPFLDGNGRTARALEALMLRRCGLKEILFVPMSNYYYDEKDSYLGSLAKVRANRHDLTHFLNFALKGVELQAKRLTEKLKRAVSREIFRNFMAELSMRLETTRKRVIVKRQLQVLEVLLEKDAPIRLSQLIGDVGEHYKSRKHRFSALARDLNRLVDLGAVSVEKVDTSLGSPFLISVNLDWPTTITETDFFERLRTLPKAKTTVRVSRGM